MRLSTAGCFVPILICCIVFAYRYNFIIRPIEGPKIKRESSIYVVFKAIDIYRYLVT